MATLIEQSIDPVNGLYLKASNKLTVTFTPADIAAIYNASGKSTTTTATTMKNQIVTALTSSEINAAEISLTFNADGTLSNFGVKTVH